MGWTALTRQALEERFLFNAQRGHYACWTKDSHGSDKEWGYVPLSVGEFVRVMDTALKVFHADHGKAADTFLEVGCGPGWITKMVDCLGMNATGLEKNPAYCQIARAICGESHVIEADALTYQEYGKYDIIYFYMPFKDDKMRKALVSSMAKQAKGVIASVDYGLEGTVMEINARTRMSDEGACIYSAKKKSMVECVHITRTISKPKKK